MWKCQYCGHYNQNNVNNCTNPNCRTSPNQRRGEHYWKCKCGSYQYSNAPYCSKCGGSKSTHCVHEG